MTTEPKLTKKQQDEKDFKEIWAYKPKTEKMGFYIWLSSGLIILAVGIFLTISDSVATGITAAGRQGTGGGQPTFITGPGVIVIGLFILIPLLLRRGNNKKIIQ